MKRTLTFCLAFTSLSLLIACNDEGPATKGPPTLVPGGPTEGQAAPPASSATSLPPALAKKVVASHDNPTSITACFTRADAAALKVSGFSSGDGCAMAVNLGDDVPAKFNIAASAAERASGERDACCYVAPKVTP